MMVSSFKENAMNGEDDIQVLVFWCCSFGKTATTNECWPESIGESCSVDHQASLYQVADLDI